jgi:hypothetical protein
MSGRVTTLLAMLHCWQRVLVRPVLLARTSTTEAEMQLRVFPVPLEINPPYQLQQTPIAANQRQLFTQSRTVPT